MPAGRAKRPLSTCRRANRNSCELILAAVARRHCHLSASAFGKGVQVTSQNAARRLHIDKRAEQLLQDAATDNPAILLSTKELAERLGVSVQFLEIARSRGHGPRFVRLSATIIRYRWGDVCEWLQRRSFAWTSNYADGGGSNDNDHGKTVSYLIQTYIALPEEYKENFRRWFITEDLGYELDE